MMMLRKALQVTVDDIILWNVKCSSSVNNTEDAVGGG